MRALVGAFFLFALGGCSSGSTSPDNACTASNPNCTGHADSGLLDATADTGSDVHVEAAVCNLQENDAGVWGGCEAGGTGNGDHDDGGGVLPPPPPDAAMDAADLAFGDQCWHSDQCASDFCYDYPARGQFCTNRCVINSDAGCPAPSPGCNGMGACRQPDPDAGL